MYKQYNTPETAFVLNLDFDISPTHDARFISLFVDSNPDEELLPKTSHTGRPAHHPRMLLKIFSLLTHAKCSVAVKLLS